MASWNNWNLETDRTNNPAESINARINGEFLKKHPKFEKAIAVLKIVQNETDRLFLQKMCFHNFNRKSAETNKKISNAKVVFQNNYLNGRLTEQCIKNI